MKTYGSVKVEMKILRKNKKEILEIKITNRNEKWFPSAYLYTGSR